MKRPQAVTINAALLATAALGTLCAQTNPAPAPVGNGNPPPASVAGTILYTKPSMANTFAAANPTLTFVGAASNGLVYLQESTGKHALRTGPGLTYQQNGHWYPTQLQVASASDGSGWLLAGTSIVAKLNGGSNTDQSLALTYDSTVFKLQTPDLAYSGQDTFTFKENGTQWTLRVTEYKVSIETTVAARQGKSGGAHAFSFTAPTIAALSTDNNGHFHVGQDVTITHPLVVGADKKLYDICSPWSTDTQNVSFTCDDSGLPNTAFPYVIDPDFETGPYQSNLSGSYPEEQCCSEQEYWTYPNFYADFNVSVNPASSFDSVSFDTSQFSFSWQATAGSPACTYSGGGGSVNYPTAIWSLNTVWLTYKPNWPRPRPMCQPTRPISSRTR